MRRPTWRTSTSSSRAGATPCSRPAAPVGRCISAGMSGAIATHLGAVAAAVPLPVLIYNFPAVVGRSIPAPLVARLASAYDSVLGIKETVDSISHIHEVIARVNPAKR